LPVATICLSVRVSAWLRIRLTIGAFHVHRICDVEKVRKGIYRKRHIAAHEYFWLFLRVMHRSISERRAIAREFAYCMPITQEIGSGCGDFCIRQNVRP
jgi:hypothetical protein